MLCLMCKLWGCWPGMRFGTAILHKQGEFTRAQLRSHGTPQALRRSPGRSRGAAHCWGAGAAAPWCGHNCGRPVQAGESRCGRCQPVPRPACAQVGVRVFWGNKGGGGDLCIRDLHAHFFQLRRSCIQQVLELPHPAAPLPIILQGRVRTVPPRMLRPRKRHSGLVATRATSERSERQPEPGMEAQMQAFGWYNHKSQEKLSQKTTSPMATQSPDRAGWQRGPCLVCELAPGTWFSSPSRHYTGIL